VAYLCDIFEKLIPLMSLCREKTCTFWSQRKKYQIL
jgi:hypothetical protein